MSVPTLQPEEAVRELCSSGYAGIELKVGDPPHAPSSPAAKFLVGNRCTLPLSIDAAEHIGRLCTDAGLSVVGLGPYLAVGDRDTLALVLDMAVAAGAPQIRFQAPRFTAAADSFGSLLQRSL